MDLDWLSSETLANIKGDSLYFGSAETTQQLWLNGALNTAWLKSTVLTLLGFAVYQAVVRKHISTSGVSNLNLRTTLDDILKFGTMLIVSRLLSGNKLTDVAWGKSSINFLAGFAVYDMILNNYVPVVGTGKTQVITHDAVKVITVFVVSWFLDGRISSTGDLVTCLTTAASYIAGLSAYTYFLA